MRKIKVLFLQPSPTWEAIASVHSQLMRHFDPARVEVHAACNDGPPAPGKASPRERLRKIPGLKLVELPFGPSVSGGLWSDALTVARRLPAVPGVMRELTRYAREQQIDVIHVGQKPRDAVYGVLLARLTGARCQLHLHSKFDLWASAPVRWALRHADGVACVSHFVARSLREGGFGTQHLEVVYNGINAQDWDPSVDGAPLRRELGVPADALLLGIVGRLTAWKGHRELLQALPLVQRALPGARLWVVGGHDHWGDPGQHNSPTALAAFARQLGVLEAVRFLGHRPDIQQVLAALDLFVLPAWEEGFGLAFLEAMVMKKPVVGWSSGAAPEVVPPTAGRLVEGRNVQALAESIIELGRDPARRQRMGEAGRAFAAQHFTHQRAASEMEAAYRRTLERPARRSWTRLGLR